MDKKFLTSKCPMGYDASTASHGAESVAGEAINERNMMPEIANRALPSDGRLALR